MFLLGCNINESAEEDDMEDEFGFYEGEEYTLAKFEKKAKNFSEKWFPSRPTPEQVEEEFWRIVETAEDSVKVLIIITLFLFSFRISYIIFYFIAK